MAGSSPRRATYFLLLRQKKVGKEKAAPLAVSPAGQPAVLAHGAALPNSLSSLRSLRSNSDSESVHEAHASLRPPHALRFSARPEGVLKADLGEPHGGSGFEGKSGVGAYGMGAGSYRIGSVLRMRRWPGCAPGDAVTFFLSRQKESNQRKRRPHWLRPSASLRAACDARSRGGAAELASRLRAPLRQPQRVRARSMGLLRSPCPPHALRFSARPEGR